jgi:hypothetical protein
MRSASSVPWSSGIATTRPGTDLRTLFDEADRALYAQKARRQRSAQSAGLDAVPHRSESVPTKRVPRPVA